MGKKKWPGRPTRKKFCDPGHRFSDNFFCDPGHCPRNTYFTYFDLLPRKIRQKKRFHPVIYTCPIFKICPGISRFRGYPNQVKPVCGKTRFQQTGLSQTRPFWSGPQPYLWPPCGSLPLRPQVDPREPIYRLVAICGNSVRLWYKGRNRALQLLASSDKAAIASRQRAQRHTITYCILGKVQ